MPNHFLRILAAVGTLALLLSNTALAGETITPNIDGMGNSQVVATEDFDDDLAGSPIPSDPDSWYSVAASGGMTVTTDQSASSPHSLFINGDDMAFHFPQGICQAEGLNLKFRLTSLPVSSSNPWFIGFGATANPADQDSNPLAGLKVSNLGTVSVVANSGPPGVVDGSATISGITIAIDTWYSVSMYSWVIRQSDGLKPSCDDDEDADDTGADGDVDDGFIVAIVPTAGGSVKSQIRKFGSMDPGIDPDYFIAMQSGSPTVDFYLDDMEFVYRYDPGALAGYRFCADSTADNFGYDYVEEVNFDENPQNDFTDISLQDAYEFEGDSGNSAYLGKGFSTGSTSFATRFRIESAKAVAGEGSIFRIAYTTGATTLTAGSAGDSGADQTAASDGDDGGNFDNHIKVSFLEDGDDWKIRFYSNVGGAGLTQLGTTTTYGDPDIPTTFNFTVNTETTLVSVRDDTGTLITSTNLPAGLEGATLKDQWFIGKGTQLNPNAFTYLDDTQDEGDTSDSTCIFDLVGTAVVVGSSGGTPGSITPPPIDQGDSCTTVFCVSEADVPDGFTAAAFNGFLGIVLVGMISVGGVGAIAANAPGLRIGAIGIILFAALGYLMAFYFGLLPLWPIIAAVVITGGALAFRFWKAGS